MSRTRCAEFARENGSKLLTKMTVDRAQARRVFVELCVFILRVF